MFRLKSATFGRQSGRISRRNDDKPQRKELTVQNPEIIIVPVIFGVVGWIVKIVTDAATRRRLIDKGLVEEGVKNLYPKVVSPALTNLKWGLVLLGIGVAAMVSFWFPDVISEEGTLGLMCIFAGVAFLVYYGIASQREKEQRSNPSN